MVEKKKDDMLLEKAQLEENNYNWTEAANLYEKTANSFLEKAKIDKAAFTYKKLGFVNMMASEIVESANDLSDKCKCAIDAYDMATKLFNQIESNAEELECIGEKLYIQIFLSIHQKRNGQKELYLQGKKI